MRALSIRQPYAELILRGIKTIEYRTIPTRVVGERFHIYASKAPAKRAVWSDDLAAGDAPAWMIELARQVGMIEAEMLAAGAANLPTGVIVGSAVIERVTRGESFFEWHLTQIERAKKLRKPTGHPQPVWFRPF